MEGGRREEYRRRGRGECLWCTSSRLFMALIITPVLQISENDIMRFIFDELPNTKTVSIWHLMSPGEKHLVRSNIQRQRRTERKNTKGAMTLEFVDNQKKPWSCRKPDPSVWSETGAVTLPDWVEQFKNLILSWLTLEKERSLGRKETKKAEDYKPNMLVKSEYREETRERGQGCYGLNISSEGRERERERQMLGWLREERELERLSTEACGSSLKKIAPSSLLYYITLVDKKNPTSSKVITAQ